MFFQYCEKVIDDKKIKANNWQFEEKRESDVYTKPNELYY